MRILLVPQKANYPRPEPCGGILGQGLPYLAATCRMAGHEVAGFNLSSMWCHGSAPIHLEMELRDRLEAFQPHLIGLTGLSADYLFVRDALHLARHHAPHTPVVLGGGLLSYDPDFIMSHLRPDFGLIGDGEETLVMLLEALEGRRSLEEVPNLLYWQDGHLCRTARCQMSRDLDRLPYPDYAPFDFDTHLRTVNQVDHHFYTHTRHQPRILPLSLGRSCPFKCTFCCHLGGETYRQRSVASALAEIAHFYERYQFNILCIYDELFSTNAERIETFCEGVRRLREREGMDFDWTCALRVSSARPEVLRTMKASGCFYIGYGFESGSDPILKSMKKGSTVARIEQAIVNTVEAGLGAQGALLFGDPAETETTLQETMAFYERHAHHAMIGYGYVTPYPGSELFERCLSRGLISDRQTYYEHVTIFTEGQVNMTDLPDSLLWETTRGARARAQDRLPRVEARAFTWVGACAVDRDAPLTLRRTDYRVEADCPHCSGAVDYRLPLRRKPGQRSCQEVFCPLCHRRFILDLDHDHLGEPAVPRVLFDYAYGDPSASFVTRRWPRYRGFELRPVGYRIQAVPGPEAQGKALAPIFAASPDAARTGIDALLERRTPVETPGEPNPPFPK